MPVTLTFYDGTDCIGGNKILLEDGGAALLFDFGTNFSAEGTYFDEFLQPRSSFGLSDLLYLGFLPPLRGLYRDDLEYPGTWEKYNGHPMFRSLEVQGVFLSHAHYDHCGYFPYLREDIPVFMSLTSALLCKVLQDTGGGNRLNDICYVEPREFKDGLIQKAKSTKSNPNPARQRPHRAFGGSASAGVCSFWERSDSSRGLISCPLESCGDAAEVGGLQVCFWPVDHSIPGAGAYGIKTSEGWIIYTGDLRLHGKHSYLTRQFIGAAAELGPTVLICEGTHPEVTRPVGEEHVAANCFEVVKEEDGLVVADFGPRNVERLLSFLEIAGETGRLLVLTTKDVYLLEALHAVGGLGIPHPYESSQIALYVRPQVVRKKWENALLDRFAARAPERLVGAAKIKADPGRYILCFSYYDFHALLDIEPEGGTYIYSSSEAFNEEMLLDHEKVRNWIDLFGFKLYGSLGREREKSGFHASGHIHGPGIEELVESIKPEILIPVHTESRDFFRRFEDVCRVIYPQKGKSITLK